MEKFEIVLVSKKEVYSAFQKELLSKEKLSISLAVEDIVRERIGERIVTGAAKSGEQANPHSKKIVGVSFCWGGLVCYYMDLTETSGEHANCVSKMRLLQKLLSNNSICLYLHNAKGQLLLLRQQSTICLDNLPLCGDPLVAAWLLNPDGKEESLHSLVMSQCREYSGLLSHSVKTRSHRAAASNQVEPYVCASTEACLTYHLCEKLHSQLESEGLMTAYSEVELPLVRVLVESEAAGFRFNVKEGRKMLQSIENVKTFLEQTAHDLVNWKFNLNSPKHVAIALFDKLGLKPLDQFGRVSKSRSTNKDVLSKLAGTGSPLPTIILEHRKVEYIITQNLAPLLHHVEKVANTVTRIQPCYSTHTSTGRIYMRDPNLQNIPKEFTIQEHLMCPRMAFEAAPGHTLISADYSQVELRLLAHFSQDPTLIKVLCSSKDIFREIAAKLQDIPYCKITDIQRQHAKKVCYGILYGMSAEKLVTEIDCQTLAEARTFVYEFTNKFPLADKFLSEVAEKCCKESTVETLKGRKRYFQISKASSAHSERQAKNTVLQGSAADLTKVAMLQVHKLLEVKGLASCTKLVLHLHDELIYEAPSCSIQEVAKVIKHGMETAVKLNVPLPVKMKSGASWGQLHELDS
ncbi:hypothetical protein B566_EDAN012739 [Ephemera danica]|nr:hypothetical protein B566_EDAN012739 [Ephemera danica]